MSRTTTTVALLVFIATCSLLHADSNWNQFRGPHADGSTTATGLPIKFKEGSPEIQWKVPLKGRAWSSPVVWGNQIWLTNAPEIQNPPGLSNTSAIPDSKIEPLKIPIRLSAVCLDAKTGDTLHDITVFEISRPQFTHLTNSYASPTPWIEAGRLYVHYGAYGTACIDTATGEKLWEQRDLKCQHWRGAGSSPVVHGDRIFLTFDGYDKQFIACLNKNTGKVLWNREREVNYGTDNGDAKKAYSTPRVITVNGRDLLISPFAMATIAYDITNGNTVWKVYHGGMNAAARPLFGNGLVYINAGDGKDALIAVDPGGKGDVSKSHIKWRVGKLTPKRPSQLLIGDRYFMVGDDGVASCLNANTGKLIWKARVGGRYWASPLYADGHIYCFDQNGKIAVFKAANQYTLVARNQLDDGFNASPAVIDSSLILRTMSHVYRVSRVQK
jgi:outer membrane protein assembly factor BamB